jgi:hypothetical protein
MPHSQHAMAPSIARSGTDVLSTSNKALEQEFAQLGSATRKNHPDDLTLQKPSGWTTKNAPMVSELIKNAVGIFV